MSSSAQLNWREFLVFAAMGLVLSGCGTGADPEANTKFKPVDEEPEKVTQRDNEKPAEVARVEQPGAQKPPVEGKAKPGSKAANNSKDPALAGPTGDKVKLVRTLLRTIDSEPPGNTRQEKLANLQDQLEQILGTSEEILATEGAPQDARDQALMARMLAAGKMLEHGMHKDAKEMLKVAATELMEASNPQWSTLARVQLFRIHAVDVLQGQPRDAKEVLTALQTLLDAGGDADVITQQVIPLVMQLEQAGYPKDGVEAMVMLGDHFAKSENLNEALVGKQLQVSALVGKFRSKEGDPEKLAQEIVDKAKEIIKDTKADASGVGMLFQLAYTQEGVAPKLAGQLYDVMEETYAEHKDAKLAAQATELIASGRQRLGLVGKPLAVEGMLADEKPFDWAEYKGKVVLVHFWALISRENVNDLSIMARLHKRFHDRGLEIVGVNLDKSLESLQQLFENQQLSWSTVVGAEEDQRGDNHPTAKQAGVTSETLPYHVLIGSDGKVVAAGLHGPELEEAIVKLLPEEKTPSEKPDEKDDKPEDKDDKPEGTKDQPEDDSK